MPGGHDRGVVADDQPLVGRAGRPLAKDKAEPGRLIRSRVRESIKPAIDPAIAKPVRQVSMLCHHRGNKIALPG